MAMEGFKEVRKSVCLLALLMLMATALGIVYGFVTGRHFTFSYALTANFLVGSVVSLTGLVVWFGPMRFRNQRLIDHTTYVSERHALREKKRRKGMEILLIGIVIILITALVELALWQR